jgi:preprotein translocase subunit SecG
METIIGILPYIQVTLSVLLIIAVLMQRSATGLGAAFGGDGFSSSFSTRRGVEKILFNATIVIAILFVLTTLMPLLLA